MTLVNILYIDDCEIAAIIIILILFFKLLLKVQKVLFSNCQFRLEQDRPLYT